MDHKIIIVITRGDFSIRTIGHQCVKERDFFSITFNHSVKLNFTVLTVCSASGCIVHSASSHIVEYHPFLGNSLWPRIAQFFS